MKNVAGADRQVHDLTCAHEYALECCLMACFFDVLDGGDDERSRNLVELAVANRLDDVSL